MVRPVRLSVGTVLRVKHRTLVVRPIAFDRTRPVMLRELTGNDRTLRVQRPVS